MAGFSFVSSNRVTTTSELSLLKHFGENLDRRCADGRELRDVLIEGLLRIRTKSGRLVPLTPNRAQREFAARCGRRNIVLKARQLGLTTYVAARFFVSTITKPGTLTVQVAHDQRSAEEIFRIVHRFLENLDVALREGVLATSRANVCQIVFPRLDSEYRVETAADPNAGRGLTIQNLHCSEVARWSGDASETLASLRAAVPPDGEIVLESTPRGAGGVFYEEWMRAEETGYVRHFAPWWWEPSYVRRSLDTESLTTEEKQLIRLHDLTPEQIAFRRELQGNFGKLASQEFAEDPVSCFLTSGECVFDSSAIERRLSAVCEATESRDNGRELIWWPPATAGEYVIGVDPAGGGTDGDYACAEVVERSTGLQCAELRGHFTPAELAVRVARLAREYNDALVAVERNNHGHAVLAYLHTSERYENVFEQNGQAGWLTSAASKPRIIERLAAILVTEPMLINGRGVLEECRTFVRGKDGCAAAANGSHDDRVMALAIAHEVRELTAGRPTGRLQLATFRV